VKPELIAIKLNEINSVPEIYYRGERIKNLQKVSLDWTTNDEQINLTRMEITFIPEDTGPNSMTIGYNLDGTP
jgi:hypothetical protein